MNNQKLQLSEKELKVLTWMDDVTGMDNRIEGDELVIFYAAMPSYWEQRMSLEIAVDTIHDIYDIEEENV